MQIVKLTIVYNSVVIEVHGKDPIIFKEEDENTAVKRFMKMQEDLPTLIEEIVLGGAFEPTKEEDVY